MSTKYYFKCRKCGKIINGFKEFFESGQKCSCGCNFVDAVYTADGNRLKELIFTKEPVKNLWHYFDFLPLNDKNNIVSAGEGISPVDRWNFLEKIASEYYNINCKIYVMRHNFNDATRTFKDIAGTLAASVLKELGIKQYAVASTGNTANAFSHYLAKAGISLYVFMPENAVPENIASVSAYGQKAVIVKGDYADAKKLAADFTSKYNIPMTIGNIDPLRVESKKTWVYEWLRLTGELPTVYVQALSGGTGPIAVDKALNELEPLGLVKQRPRYISVQPSLCDPMTQAWNKAKAEGFPQGWQNDYPKIKNPATCVQTLGTGIPGTYPIVAQLTKDSGGEIISFDEKRLSDVARLASFETLEKLGPASAVAMGGLLDSLKNGLIKNDDVVMLNLGEGVERAPFFLAQTAYNEEHVTSADEIKPFDRQELEKSLLTALLG